MRKPTQRQLELLAFIHDYTVTHQGIPPSHIEMGMLMDITPANVRQLVNALTDKGCLVANEYKHRALVLTPWGRQQLRDSGRDDMEVVPVQRGAA